MTGRWARTIDAVSLYRVLEFAVPCWPCVEHLGGVVAEEAPSWSTHCSEGTVFFMRRGEVAEEAPSWPAHGSRGTIFFRRRVEPVEDPLSVLPAAAPSATAPSG